MKTWITNTLLASLAVLAPIKATLLVVGFLIFADLITGVLRARKQGEKFSSRALARSIYKTGGYQLAIISGFLVERYLVPDVPIVKILVGLVAVAEMTSILENVKAATGVDLLSSLKALHVAKDKDK